MVTGGNSLFKFDSWSRCCWHNHYALLVPAAKNQDTTSGLEACGSEYGDASWEEEKKKMRLRGFGVRSLKRWWRQVRRGERKKKKGSKSDLQTQGVKDEASPRKIDREIQSLVFKTKETTSLRVLMASKYCCIIVDQVLPICEPEVCCHYSVHFWYG